MAETPGSAPTVPPPPSPRRLRLIQVLTAMAIIVSLGAALYFREHIQELRRYGYITVFLVGLLSNATLILPVPGLAISSVMGSVFNPWIVGLVGGLGQALGELTGYLAGYSGQAWIDERPTYNRLMHWMQRYGALAISVLAFIPNPLFDVAGVAAGALRLPVWKFLVGCAVGKVSKNIVFALAGHYGLEIVYRLFNPLGP